MSTGEHLLHVLNTLESRAVVLEAELHEINEDIEANSTMCRKYGESFFTEGTSRLAQVQAEKREKLAEIRRQLQATNQSVRQGKQLLGSLTDVPGRGEYHSLVFEPTPGMPSRSAWQESSSPDGSPMRVVTASPILYEGRSHQRY
eukprot:CAMPEP_0195633658 /NCGR_PEP_ID=MMETSP0815-20121206/22267_1 /TAXON_ID=97485 /ORGANISM="Prymnesium parvum, Strain Texoma1" /LENGTH=144 /DNA_ID=CAMNT_0040775343 /DNA_START=1 /DNA_END=435 /DNA_ORIENTATION=-